MAYASPEVDRQLPSESDMDRDDALDAFIAVINTVEPDHPDLDDPWPISRENVDYGVTRSYLARCGPRCDWKTWVSYDTRMTYINGISRERHLALLIHEVTHVPVNSGSHSSGHPPEFWREMAFHALELRDALADGALDGVFGDVDVDAFLEEVADDPSAGTVDRRSWTVDECKAEMRRLLGLDG